MKLYGRTMEIHYARVGIVASSKALSRDIGIYSGEVTSMRSISTKRPLHADHTKDFERRFITKNPSFSRPLSSSTKVASSGNSMPDTNAIAAAKQAGKEKLDELTERVDGSVSRETPPDL